MSYASGHPVRQVGGRLILDFLNTADWRADGTVAHEKLEELADVHFWMAAVGVADRVLPDTIGALTTFRAAVRPAFTGGPGADVARKHLNDRVQAVATDTLATDGQGHNSAPLLDVLAIDAMALLADPRLLTRLKMCPGDHCGWLFLDETKNQRRKWCMMETCGNRAKARRSYARRTAVAG